VKPETADRVSRIANEMGYAPNAIARGLVRNNTKTIGVIIPDIMNDFFPEVARGIEDYARTQGFSTFLCNSSMSIERERQYIEELYGYRAGGIIVLPVSDELSHIFSRFRPEDNVVFLSYKPAVDRCSIVGVDDVAIGYTATRYLLRLGHRRIAFFGGKESGRILEDRYNGYRRGMDEEGLPPIAHFAQRPGTGDESDPIKTSFHRFLLDADPPTGIVAYNDMTAIDLMERIEGYGLRVPEDVSVIGVDNISLAGNFRINLTTIGQDRYRLGELSARKIVSRFYSEEDISDRDETLLETELIVRGTCTARRA
jgi:LacI family transcriptional regulator